MKKLSYLIVYLLVAIAPATLLSDDGELMKAMRDEIKRSMSELHLESLERPYFIEYSLEITRPATFEASLGYLVESEHDSYRANLTVGLRVGDYKFDNSNFLDFAFSFFGGSDDEENYKKRSIQTELDYRELRRQLWLATDAAYKQAAEQLSKKKAALKNKVRKDTTHDFLRMEPAQYFDKAVFPKIDAGQYEKLCKDLSAVFKKYPQIARSAVDMEILPRTIYYVNSEGTEYVRTEIYTGLEILAYLQNEDGMPLADAYNVLCEGPWELPGRDSLMNAAKQVAEKVIALNNASLLDEPYSGPILFEGQAAAQLFSQIFAPNLVTQRKPLTSSGFSSGDNFMAFQSKIGGRVLPEFMTIEAKPNTKELDGNKLVGHFEYDGDGVKAQDVILVKDGYLKNLLSSRVPTRRVRKSNGHKRGGAPMLSNIIISSEDDKKKPTDKLKERMMELCKDRELPYGLIVRKIMDRNVLYTTMYRLSSGQMVSSGSSKMPALVEVVKVYPDGREELVRGNELKGLTVQSFKDIINTGDSQYIMNYWAPSVISPFMVSGDRFLPAAIVAPDLLFEDGEIKPIDEDFPKPPLLGNPLGSR